MVLPIGDNFIHDLDIRMSLPLRLTDLFRVAAALGDEVLAVGFTPLSVYQTSDWKTVSREGSKVELTRPTCCRLKSGKRR
jgi:hypothetical protein